MARVVRLILVDDAGAPLGALPDIDIEDPWWPQVGDIVTVARERFGVDLFVLRLVDAQGGTGMTDGLVSYTAEAMGPTPPLMPALEDLPYDEDPHRAPWARPGGIASIVAWADGALRERGTPRIGPVRQVKTWNLSCVLQLPTADGVVWCKSVPRFFAHEPAVVSLLARERAPIVPSVVAANEDLCSLLLEDLGPEVLWDADEQVLTRMVRALVALQVDWADRTDDLLGIGMPDHRSGGLASQLQTFLARGDVRATIRSDELGPWTLCRRTFRIAWPPWLPAASRTPSCTATSTRGTGSGVTTSCSCSTGSKPRGPPAHRYRVPGRDRG